MVSIESVSLPYRPKPSEQHKYKGILCILGIDKLTIDVRLSNSIGTSHCHLRIWMLMAV